MAILGTKEFDITTVDPATISLGREGIADNVSPIRWNYDDVATPFEGEMCDCHELDGDGFMDMILQFDAQKLVTNLRLEELTGGTIPLKVIARQKEESGGNRIEGQDCARILSSTK